MWDKRKKKNGITLIVLIITIIVILILVGVSISAAIKEGGLFKKSADAIVLQEIARCGRKC